MTCARTGKVGRRQGRCSSAGASVDAVESMARADGADVGGRRGPCRHGARARCSGRQRERAIDHVVVGAAAQRGAARKVAAAGRADAAAAASRARAGRGSQGARRRRRRRQRRRSRSLSALVLALINGHLDVAGALIEQRHGCEHGGQRRADGALGRGRRSHRALVQPPAAARDRRHADAAWT